MNVVLNEHAFILLYFPINAEFRQGSILGPTLFPICKTDINAPRSVVKWEKYEVWIAMSPKKPLSFNRHIYPFLPPIGMVDIKQKEGSNLPLITLMFSTVM